MSTWRQRLARVIAGAPPRVALRTYAGAMMSRLRTGWQDVALSADDANDAALRPLRDRARQLVRDNAVAQSWVRLAGDNIVGPDGFALEVTSRDRTVAEQVKAAFYTWCKAEHCDVAGRLAFSDIERLAAENWRGADGEVLIRLWRGYGPHGLQLQVLDPDLLDETYTRRIALTGNEVRAGVEVDGFGKPVAYHLWTTHPSEAGPRQRVRVPASDILHLYRPARPGQTRGITPFAAVMRDLYHLGEMVHATIVGQQVAAMQTTWLVNDDPGAPPLIENRDGKQEAVLSQEPAATNILPSGWKPMAVQPGIPQSTYADFHRLAGHQIAVGLGTHYAQLFGDARDANASSQRVMTIRERRMWRSDQELLRRTLHERVFAVWLQQAVLAGAVRLRGAPLESVVASWLPTKWDWTDPMKDVNSAALEIALGLNSRTAVAADKGRDYATIIRQRAEEERLAEELGVTLYTPTTVTLPVEDDAGDADGVGRQPELLRPPAPGPADRGRGLHPVLLARAGD